MPVAKLVTPFCVVTASVCASPYGDYVVTVKQDGVVCDTLWMSNEPEVRIKKSRGTGEIVVIATADYGEREELWL